MSICLDGRHAKDKMLRKRATPTLQIPQTIPKLG